MLQIIQDFKEQMSVKLILYCLFLYTVFIKHAEEAACPDRNYRT